MLKYGFMGLKCWSWYPGNAPDDLNINTFSDFLKYLGEEAYYRERPTKEQVCEYAIKLREQLGRNIKLSDFENNKQVKKSIFVLATYIITSIFFTIIFYFFII